MCNFAHVLKCTKLHSLTDDLCGMWLHTDKTIKNYFNLSMWTLFIFWFKKLKIKCMIQLEMWVLARYLRILNNLLLFLKVWWSCLFFYRAVFFQRHVLKYFTDEIMSGICFRMIQPINRWRFKWNMICLWHNNYFFGLFCHSLGCFHGIWRFQG